MNALLRGGALPMVVIALATTSLFASAASSSPAASLTASAEPRRSLRNPEGHVFEIKSALAAARGGEPWAMDYLANAYATGDGVTKNAEEAATWWNAATTVYRERAASGDVEAMNTLAMRYNMGYGDYPARSGVNEAQSALWTKAAIATYRFAAAVHGDVAAMDALAHLFLTDEVSEEEVAQWQKAAAGAYLRMAEAGDTEAMVRVAELYRFGAGVEEDDEASLRWYQAAAAKQNVDALLHLAKFAGSDDEATPLILSAANAGGRYAMYRLALDHDIGRRGLSADASLATSWYEKAALKGHSAAMSALQDERFRALIANTAAAGETASSTALPGTRCTWVHDTNYNVRLNEPPIIALNIDSASQDGSTARVILHAAGADPEGYTMLFTFSVNGGAVTEVTSLSDEPDSQTRMWTITKPGSYTATVEADDGAGCISFASVDYAYK